MLPSEMPRGGFLAFARIIPVRMAAHVPVLLDEALQILAPRPRRTYVDCTVGLGGHAAEILRRGGRVIGLDLDASNLAIAERNLAAAGGKFVLRRANFAALPGILAELGIERVHGILADLGVASPQIDDPARGFSYRRAGPLDMRMDPARGRTASEILDRIGERELAEALRELGDEEDAEKIARLVLSRRPVRTTGALAQSVCEARNFSPERAAGAKLHPAARTFQALRILVNREMANLDRLLDVIPSCLRPGGVAVILSYHSGEDRRVKRSFREGRARGVYSRIDDEPAVPAEEEIARNPRARSAKLRSAIMARR